MVTMVEDVVRFKTLLSLYCSVLKLLKWIVFFYFQECNAIFYDDMKDSLIVKLMPHFLACYFQMNYFLISA